MEILVVGILPPEGEGAGRNNIIFKGSTLAVKPIRFAGDELSCRGTSGLQGHIGVIIESQGPIKTEAAHILQADIHRRYVALGQSGQLGVRVEVDRGFHGLACFS